MQNQTKVNSFYQMKVNIKEGTLGMIDSFEINDNGIIL